MSIYKPFDFRLKLANVAIVPLRQSFNYTRYSTINDMVSQIAMLQNSVVTATFNNFDEETQFICSLDQSKMALIIFQEGNIPVLSLDGRSDRFISPENIAQVMSLSLHVTPVRHIFLLRRPTNPFLVSSFVSCLDASRNVGCDLLGIITFAGSNFSKELVF